MASALMQQLCQLEFYIASYSDMQKPNIMLATSYKHTTRWMVSVYQCKKRKMKAWNEVPFLTYSCNGATALNNSKAVWFHWGYGKQKNSNEECKRLTRTFKPCMLQTLMNGTDEWLLLQAVSLHKSESSVHHSHHIFPGISDDCNS